MAILQGTGVTRGIAMGPAFLYQPATLPIPERQAESTLAEMDRFEEALGRAQAEVRALHATTLPLLRREADRLLEAQDLLLEDPALVDRTRGRMLQGQSAEQAWWETLLEYLAIFTPIQDEDLEARVADLRDVGQRVLAALLGRPAPAPFAAARGTILLAETLGPAEALQLAANPPLGLCLARGNLTTPAAIVARRLGLPAAVGVGQELLQKIAPGTMVVVDGSTGTVESSPDEQALSLYRQRQRLLKAAQPAFDVSVPAQTADGWRVDVRVDLDQPGSLLSALARGAEGIGLARTDFLYLGRKSPPGEDEQTAAYGDLLDQVPEGKVTFCTISTGLEDPLPFPAEPEVGDPLLGLRGIRLSLAYLSTFREQLRAILRAGAKQPLAIAFPMVETLAELRAAQEWLRRAQQDLENAEVAHQQKVPLALLLQTPLSVLNLPALAGEVDAFFLDLDRLTEYLLACNRRNLRVAHLFRPLHPVVLRLAGEAIATAHNQGKRLEACGEAAGQPGAIAVLLGLGVDGFCLPADRIPAAKALLQRLTIPESQDLARRVLQVVSAPEVEVQVEEFLGRKGGSV